jgi:hypothetical protein
MFRIETIWNKNWEITIDKENLIVTATQTTPHGMAAQINYRAKTIKQAWFAYFNPRKVRGLLDNR